MVSSSNNYLKVFKIHWLTRTETPWHLTNGHGNSAEPTGGHVWSTRGHRWERLEFHQWPSVDHRWKTPWSPVKIDSFRSDKLVCGTCKCRKKEKITCNLAENFAITSSAKAITQSKVPNSTIFEDIDAGLFQTTQQVESKKRFWD